VVTEQLVKGQKNLPNIVYDREEFLEVIEKFPTEPPKKRKIILYLVNTQQKVDEIKCYQLKVDRKKFYRDMATAISEIQAIIKTLYKLTKPQKLDQKYISQQYHGI
jgi:hypothetical protein